MRIIIPERELPEILKRVGRGERVDPCDTVAVRKDGRRVDVSLTVSPIRDAGGRIIGASSIARDITHREEAEAAVRERDILRYVASLATAVVMGDAQLLAAAIDATGCERVDEMLKAVSRMQEIVTRLKAVTRIRELTDEASRLRETLDLSRSSEPEAPHASTDTRDARGTGPRT